MILQFQKKGKKKLKEQCPSDPVEEKVIVNNVEIVNRIREYPELAHEAEKDQKIEILAKSGKSNQKKLLLYNNII